MHIVPHSRAAIAAPRMADLATLPVFYMLTNKPVLIAGGSDAAAWKAELLVAAGARVTVHAPGTCAPEMLALADEGRLMLVQASWEEADWSGLVMAVGDCEENEAPAFAAHGRANGVPVNVIDKPAFCSFQFGSIVNRSPLVVGISTTGAAPILGQAVRRRIEMLLPQALAGWAEIARTMRDKVTALLDHGAERRAFWEKLADAAFVEQPSDNTITRWLGMAKQAKSGKVTLVGAGPGDAEYLTIKAVRALQAADVILFDDLVSDQVLELARREAKRILVGKRSGRPSCKQADINAMMVSLAKQGRHVVRLKSGDPMIFGRAGEEIAALEAENIPVQVVPGISAAMALAASLNISLTHRDCAQSVRFVTGHSRYGGLPDTLDWRALSDPSTTHVYYMACQNGAGIAEQLIAHGMPPHTGVAIASDISSPNETVTYTSLKDMAATLGEGTQPKGPVLIMVGDVLTRAKKTATVETSVAQAS
ncbi:uroporphyrinogen-III C-methyltransferase [Devosia sp. YR412]|uniref:siroheme synthase CysG n=1 Tax=Devosia sp. YR412 TaxID=1881030 RepID=UPI0008BF7BE0|nr:siroheme synthase CysG [Devosia sp. YR412]SEQ09848.1 uroporphyrinogen-III C-methyltransferase [Devosia sp. YR412]